MSRFFSQMVRGRDAWRGGLLVAIAVFATIFTLGASLAIVPVVSCIAAGSSAGALTFFSMPDFYQHTASSHEQLDETPTPAV